MTTKVEPMVEKWEDGFDKRFVIKTRLDCGQLTTYKYELVDELNLVKKIKFFISQSVQEAKAEGYKQALDDMFLEICKLAEPDERQPSAGDLHANMDDIHNIRTKLASLKQEEVQDEN